MEVSTLLDRTARGEHELERAIQYNLVAVTHAAQQRDPATVVLAEVGFHADGLVRVAGVASEDHRRQAVTLDRGKRDGEFGRHR